MKKCARLQKKKHDIRLIAVFAVAAVGLFSNNPKTAVSLFSHGLKSLGEVASIAIATLPDQTEFPLGSELDYAGLTIEVTDVASEGEIITEGFTLSGGDSLILGHQTITVTYESAQTEFAIDVSNEASVIAGTLTNEQQATSYAVYIMYGIGMNAASDYFNVFYELQDEYGFMDPQSKAYFLENRSHEISGINESGRLVTNTFNDAIGRYNYLAAKTGHAGLTADTTPSWLNADTLVPIFVFGAIIVAAGVFYFIARRKRAL
jgi:hypothetical protein